MIGSFNKKGDEIYIGNSLGHVFIFSAKTFKLSKTIKLSAESKQNSAITQIVFSKKGKYCLVNCSDRLRLLNVSTHQVEMEYRGIAVFL